MPEPTKNKLFQQSTLAPVVTRREVENGLFRKLIKQIESRGYVGNIDGTEADFLTAVNSIKATHGFFLNVKGVVPTRGKNMKENIFYLKRGTVSNGTVSGRNNPFYQYYEENGVGRYKEYRLPEKSKQLNYEWRYYSNHPEREDLMNDILISTFDDNVSVVSRIKENDVYVDGPEFQIRFVNSMTLQLDDVNENVLMLRTNDLFLWVPNESDDLAATSSIDLVTSNETIVNELPTEWSNDLIDE